MMIKIQLFMYDDSVGRGKRHNACDQCVQCVGASVQCVGALARSLSAASGHQQNERANRERAR